MSEGRCYTYSLCLEINTLFYSILPGCFLTCVPWNAAKSGNVQIISLMNLYSFQQCEICHFSWLWISVILEFENENNEWCIILKIKSKQEKNMNMISPYTGFKYYPQDLMNFGISAFWPGDFQNTWYSFLTSVIQHIKGILCPPL